MLCAVRHGAGIKWGRCKKLEHRVTAVLVAAGSSTRMGFDKLSFDLGGETVLERSVRAFDECPEVDELVIVTGASSENALPAANVLIYTLDNGAAVVVRPSGTEPKIKTYFTTLGKDLAEAQAQKDALAAAIEPILA